MPRGLTNRRTAQIACFRLKFRLNTVDIRPCRNCQLSAPFHFIPLCINNATDRSFDCTTQEMAFIAVDVKCLATIKGWPIRGDGKVFLTPLLCIFVVSVKK